jgi:hypothetical protein
MIQALRTSLRNWCGLLAAVLIPAMRYKQASSRFVEMFPSTSTPTFGALTNSILNVFGIS